MEDDNDNFESSDASGQRNAPPAHPREYSEDLLQAAIDRLKSRGDSSKRFACMQLPAPVFHDLCARLLDRTKTVRETAEWLAGQTPDAPTRSSVERFSAALFQEYRLAQFSERRRMAEGYLAETAQGNADAEQMILNKRLTELLTDELLSADAGDTIDTKRLFALISGVRTVAQTAFDKQKMDARIEALEKLNQERDATIKLKDQRLAEMKQKFEASLKTLQSKAAGAGKVTADDIAAARKEIFGQ